MNDTSAEDSDNVVTDSAIGNNVNDNTQIETLLLHMLSDVAVAAIVTTSPSSTANVPSISTPERIKNRTTPMDIHDNPSLIQHIPSPVVRRHSLQTETSDKQKHHMCLVHNKISRKKAKDYYSLDGKKILKELRDLPAYGCKDLRQHMKVAFQHFEEKKRKRNNKDLSSDSQ